MRHVFLVHGLGSPTINGWSLAPLRLYLVYVRGFVVHTIRYPVNTMKVEEMVDFVDAEMSKHCSKDSDEVALVGQSMGGVVVNLMHKKNWNISMTVTIGSPLRGARLLNWLDAHLAQVVRDALCKKAHTYLLENGRDSAPAPPHPYHTISMALPWTNFDGVLSRDETMLDEDHHTHFPRSSHATVFLNPWLWRLVGRELAV